VPARFDPGEKPGAGETGTGGACGRTYGLLGFRIGAGGIYGRGGICASAPVTNNKRATAVAKYRIAVFSCILVPPACQGR
jgi:hypothetical protein